jgi:TonB-linked SusC/RagA family outer membrane protein
MKIILPYGKGHNNYDLKKSFLIMKLTTLLLFINFLQISAAGFSQTGRFNLQMERATIKEALSNIESQSHYKFVYRDADIENKIVSPNLKNANIDEVLTALLAKTGSMFRVLDNNLIVIAPEGVLQQKKVTGTVVDSQTGETLIGVSILIEGTNQGTVTDVNGKFSLNIPNPNAVLKITYMGYMQEKVALKGQIKIDIKLIRDVKSLEEVVVVGYGTVRKSDVTGALTSVTEKTIKERPVQNAIQAMQGKAAGVDIVSNVRPGEVASVSIRGTRSLSASNSPLYVIDGIPLMGSINDINPNDIASMEILKDASSTAIYGSRGANGVVLITTKKGTKGQLSVNYDAGISLDRIHSATKWATSGEAIDRMRTAEINGSTYKSGTTTLNYPDPTADINKFGNSDVYTIAAIRKAYQWNDPGTFASVKMRASTAAEIAAGYPAQVPVYNSANIPTTDWIDQLTRTSITQNHLLSLSAGNETSKIYFSFGYLNNEGTQENQNYNRYTVKLNGEITPKKWLSIGASINVSSTRQEYGTINRSGSSTGANDMYGVALSQYRMARPYDTTGVMILYPGNNKSAPVWNPYIDLQNSSDETRTLNLQANAFAEATLTPWLKYRMNFGSGYRYSRTGTWQGTQSTLRRTASPQTAKDSYNTAQSETYLIENLLYFNKTIGIHTFGATIMQSAQDGRNESSAMTASGVTNDAPRWYDLAANNSSTGPDSYGTGFTESTLTSYMGRINYSLLNKYLLTATGRYDGASVLADGHKWDFFPSVALAWKIQEEKFLKPITWINELKLRTGYGVTGNSSVQPYTTSGPLSIYKYAFGTASAIGYQPYNMPNPNLRWERTSQINLGLDFVLLSHRLTGTIDLYESNTFNVIMDENIPSITGYPVITANIGKLRNRGIEIAISSVNIQTKDFRWTTDVNWSKNKEEWVNLVNGKQDMVGNNWFIGQPVQVFRTYQVAGLWQNTASDLAEIAKWAANGYTFAPGQYKPVEQGTPNYKLEDNDKVIRGTVRPKWIAGLTNTFSYKNFELSAFIYARIGQSYFSSLQPGGSTGGSYVGYVRTMDINNFWSADNPNAKWPQLTTNPKASNADVNRATFINDGSFVSVRNIALSYNFQPNVLDKLKIKRLQIYAQVLNPFLFGGAVVKAGINPDDTNGWTSVNSVGDPTGGSNNNTMIIRSWVFGVRVNF